MHTKYWMVALLMAALAALAKLKYDLCSKFNAKICTLIVLLAACVHAVASSPPAVGELVDIEVNEGSMDLVEAETGRITQVLHGYFTDPEIKQTVVYGSVVESEIEKFMQFEDGPAQVYFDVTSEEVRTCQHPDNGLTYLIDVLHGGGNIDGEYGYVSFFRVNAQTYEIETEYSEYAEHGPYDSKICGWLAKQEKLSIFSDAMSELRIDIDSYLAYRPISDLEEGETMLLPFRVIPAKTAQAWLEKLHTLSADIIINERMHSALVEIDDEQIGDWHIIQITGTEICSELAKGVVLVKHASQKDWRTIYNVEAGCSKSLNYPLALRQAGSEVIAVENDMLPVTMYYEFGGWGNSRDVIIDLRTNMITRSDKP